MLGTFLYPSEPILRAGIFDVVGSKVAFADLGVRIFARSLMGRFYRFIAGDLYEAVGLEPSVCYVAALFAATAVVS